MSAVLASYPKSTCRGWLPTPSTAFLVPDASHVQHDGAPMINKTWPSVVTGVQENAPFLRQRPALTTQHIRIHCGVWGC